MEEVSGKFSVLWNTMTRKNVEHWVECGEWKCGKTYGKRGHFLRRNRMRARDIFENFVMFCSATTLIFGVGRDCTKSILRSINGRLEGSSELLLTWKRETRNWRGKAHARPVEGVRGYKVRRIATGDAIQYRTRNETSVYREILEKKKTNESKLHFRSVLIFCLESRK